MQIEVYTELTADQVAEWKAFQAKSSHQHPRQDPCFAPVQCALGETSLFAIGREADEICAVGLFSLTPSRIVPGRFSVAAAESGPICDDPTTMIEFLRELAGTEAFAKVDTIRILPYWLDSQAKTLSTALVAAGWTSSNETFPTGILDLTPSEEDLVASFSSNARSKIKKFNKSGVEIRRITAKHEVLEFYDALNRLILRPHGLRQVPLAEQEAYFDHVLSDPEFAGIWAAYHDGRFLAGGMRYRSEKTLFGLQFVTDPDAAKAVGDLRMVQSFYLEAIRWAKPLGSTAFDFGEYILTHDRKHPKFYMYEYKRQMNPTEVERIAEHTLVLNRFFHHINTLPGNIKKATKERFPYLANKMKKIRLLIRTLKK
jgi:hypothetical protein